MESSGSPDHAGIFFTESVSLCVVGPHVVCILQSLTDRILGPGGSPRPPVFWSEQSRHASLSPGEICIPLSDTDTKQSIGGDSTVGQGGDCGGVRSCRVS